MRATAKITRADLKEYKPKRKMIALKKRLIRNNKRKGRAGSRNNLNSVIKLLYCVYKNKKITC